MNRDALLIIDMQLDFMDDGVLPVPGALALIPIINQVQSNFELIVATQDWHPKNHASFESTWPEHCVQGSVGAELHPDLDTKRISAIMRKGLNPSIDSYSAFYDNEHISATGLTGYFRERGVERIYFCGLCADVCVYYSMDDALNDGFECTLIEDATCPIDEKDYAKKLKSLQKRGLKCALSSQFGIS